MNGLFSIKNWININPGQLNFIYQQIFGIFIIFMLILYVVSLLMRNRNSKGIYRKFWTNINNFFITNTIIGAFLWFFTYEMIPFLSARFWLLLWFLSMLTWLVFIFKELKLIPKRKEEMQKQKEFQKYIP